MNIKSFVPAISWFIISTFLLCMPGNDLPKSSWFDIPFFDKWVHLIMFFLLTGLFSFPLIRSLKSSVINKPLLLICILVIVYGVVMEFVQKYLVFNRSFDEIDIVFDSIGSIAGMVTIKSYGKKIGPDRNRGRNQN